MVRVFPLFLFVAAAFALGACGASSPTSEPGHESSARVAKEIEREVEVKNVRCKRSGVDGDFRCYSTAGKRLVLEVTAGSEARPTIVNCEIAGLRRPNEWASCAVHKRES